MRIHEHARRLVNRNRFDREYGRLIEEISQIIYDELNEDGEGCMGGCCAPTMNTTMNTMGIGDPVPASRGCCGSGDVFKPMCKPIAPPPMPRGMLVGFPIGVSTSKKSSSSKRKSKKRTSTKKKKSTSKKRK